RLREAGLNEIRFDISAVDYDLTKVALAADLMACVTIEIPAVPEDFERLAALLPELKALGVSHLNLHQLRLTTHNFSRLRERPYTYLHGEKVTVLESELTALRLLARARDAGLPLNYCSFAYKNRYQGMAVRRRHAKEMVKGHEAVTESGYVRTLALWGDPGPIEAQARRLEALPEARGKWSLSGKKDRLYIHADLAPFLDPAAGQLKASYAQAALNSHISYHHPFKEVRINPRINLYLEKQPCLKDFSLGRDLSGLRTQRTDGAAPGGEAGPPPELETIQDYEWIRPGLQEYF
ncbi:MAG: radical SAM protein, partial [Desulfosarcinaceae bacterium]